MRSKSTVITYLLSFLIGLFGAHNFYLGKWIWGFFYLALTVAVYWGLFHSILAFQNAHLPIPLDVLLGNPGFRTAVSAVSVLNVFMTWDLFTLWWQVRRYGDDR